MQQFDDLLDNVKYYNIQMPVIPIDNILEELDIKLDEI